MSEKPPTEAMIEVVYRNERDSRDIVLRFDRSMSDTDVANLRRWVKQAARPTDAVERVANALNRLVGFLKQNKITILADEKELEKELVLGDALATLCTAPTSTEDAVERVVWQSMETAPEDTHILIWGEALRWRGTQGLTIGWRHSDYNGYKDRVALDGRCGPTVGFDEVTHWRPLPEPPAALTDTTEEK